MRALSTTAGFLTPSLIAVGAMVPDAAQAVAGDVSGATTVLQSEAWEPSSDDVKGVESSPLGGEAPTEAWSPELANPSEPQARAAPAPATNQALGDTGAYAFHEFFLDGDEGQQTIKVNIGTGNLFMRAKMAELDGPGVPAVAYRVYNSQNDITKGWIGPWREDYAITGMSVSSTEVSYFDGTGARWRFKADGDSWVSPAGVNASLVREADGSWALSYHRTGEIVRFNASGWITHRTDRNGVGVTYRYDAGRVVSITDAVGKSITMEYYPVGNSGSHALDRVYSGGRHVTFNLGLGQRVDTINEQDFDRPEWKMKYDNTNRISTLTDGDRSIDFEYDSSSRVVKATQSRAGETPVVTSFDYTETGTTITDPRGNSSSFEVDEQWRVTNATDQLDRSRPQTWTPNGDIETATDGFSTSGEGNVTTATYDELNNQTGITLPTGAATQALYAQGPGCADAQSGNPHQAKCSVDAAGNSQSMTYDPAGNLTTQTDTTPDGVAATKSFVYEGADGTICGGEAGQICSATDGNGGVTSYSYASGNLIEVAPPAPLGSTTYTYDAIGRVTTVVDGNGATTTYAYDRANRVVLTTFDNGQTHSQTWSRSGLLQSESDSASGSSISYEYDLLGKQTKRSIDVPAGAGIKATVNNTFDANGNLLSSDETGTEVAYVYDAANQLIALHPASESCSTDAHPAAGSGCVRYEYDENGRETSLLFPGGARQDTARDASGRPTRITGLTASGEAAVDVGLSYAQDGADRAFVQARTSHREQGIADGAVTTYTYDSLSRLTGAEEVVDGTASAAWSYVYDQAGNRVSQTRSGSTGANEGTVDYTYNAANQLVSSSADTTTWTYDGAGNQTRNGITGQATTYGDRLQVTKIGTKTYSTFGPGNDQQLKGGSSDYLTTDTGLVRETRAAAMKTWTRSSDGDLVSYTGPQAHYYVTDHLGSVLGTLSADGTWEGGYSYSPYGERRSTATGSVITTNNMRYVGGLEDSTNLYKFGARYYDATLGRFTQFDPAGQEANPYGYAESNPINLVDPTGTAARCSSTGNNVIGALGLISFAAGAAATPFGALWALGVSTGGASAVGFLGCLVPK